MGNDERNDAVSDGLFSVARLLERGVDLDAILGAIVDEVVHRLKADRGTLYLLDRDRGQIFSKAAHLPEIDEIRLDLGQGVAGVVAQTGKRVNQPDPYSDVRFYKKVDDRTGYTTHSMLVTPIRDSAEAIIGVLQVLNKKDGLFDADDEATIDRLAEQAGQILERTSLYADLRERKAPTAPRAIDYRYNRIVGSSPAMQKVYELVDKAAATSATVLLQGESGTGKGLIARAIHVNSERRDRNYVKVDCTTLPPSLIENELFGHERGAFTGADKASAGKFELAEGGTVFIDEIGELPGELQGKLLRVIQDREFERVGGTRTIKVDFRLICATNRDLEAMVAAGTFRADLYYRIRVVPIALPPLRDRGADDITRLAEHFLDVFAQKHGRKLEGFTDAAMQRLLRHRWPGNIRELENCVESAVVLADGDLVEASHLALPEGGTGPSLASALAAVADTHAALIDQAAQPGAERAALDLSRPLADVEREYVHAVLDDCDGNRSEAARRLGISRNTLSRKLKG